MNGTGCCETERATAAPAASFSLSPLRHIADPRTSINPLPLLGKPEIKKGICIDIRMYIEEGGRVGGESPGKEACRSTWNRYCVPFIHPGALFLPDRALEASNDSFRVRERFNGRLFVASQRARRVVGYASL